MGADRAVAAVAAPVGPPARMGAAGDCRGDPLPLVDRLSVARLAQGVSTLFDGTGLLLPLVRRGAVGTDQPNPGGTGPAAGGAPACALGRHHRQPERTDDRKRRPARD